MVYSKCDISVNVGDHLQDCRMENIHTRNTLVIGFSYVAVWLWYTFSFSL